MNHHPADHENAAAVGDAALRTTVRNASKLSIAMAITIPLGFVTRILIPRFLGSEKAGVFFFAESFPMFILAMMTLGVASYIQKMVPPRHEHARDILTPLCWLFGVIGILLIAGILLFMRLTHYASEVIVLTGIMAGYQAMVIFQNDVVQRLFLAIGSVSYVAILNVVAKVLVVTLVLISLWAGGNVDALGMSFFVSQLIILGLMMRQAKALGMTGGPFDVKSLKAVIRVSLPFFLGGVLATANGGIDATFLSRLAGFQEVGYYGAAQRLQGLFLLFVPLIGQSVTPALSRAYLHDREQYRQLAAVAARAFLVLAFPLSMAFTCFGKEIILLVYGEDFRPAALVTAMNGPLLIFSYISVFLAQNLTITTNGKGMAIILGFGCLFNCILDYYMIPIALHRLGPGGGACGSTLASLLVEIFICLCLLRSSKASAFSKGTMFTGLLAVLPSLLFLPFTVQWLATPLLHRIGLFSVAVPTYLVLTRMITWKDLATIKDMVKQRK